MAVQLQEKTPTMRGPLAELPPLPDASLETSTLYECDDSDTVFYLRAPGGVQQWVAVGAAGGSVGSIRFGFGTDATHQSAHDIPANAVVFYRSVAITTAFDPGTTIKLGNNTTDDLLLTAAEIEATVEAAYDDDTPTDWGAADRVLVTVAGTPAAGAGIATALYSVPLD